MDAAGPAGTHGQQDDAAPARGGEHRGGLFRHRWMHGRLRRATTAFDVVQELYGQKNREAGLEIAEQVRRTAPAPAPGEPPSHPDDRP